MSDADTAWNDDLLRDPHGVADKRSRVQRMFAAIAPKYDLNNRVHSFGMDQRWRRKAVKLAELNADDRVFDVACGTGDLSLRFMRELRRIDVRTALRGAFRERPMPTPRERAVRRVVAIDFTLEMLPLAQRKALDRLMCTVPDQRELETPKFRSKDDPTTADSGIAWLNADATALPLADASADIVSIAFGIRNVQEPHLAIAEFYRVLRPGGRVIVLEFSQPRNRLIRFFNDLYCNRIMPHTATLISGDKTGAYKYLPKSVETFMTREQMSTMLRDAGFVDVTQHPMTFGVAVVYRGYKR